MTKYDVDVTHEGRWWMIAVPALDLLTQARRVDEIEAQATSAIAVALDVPASQVEINVRSMRVGDIDALALAAEVELTDAEREALRFALVHYRPSHDEGSRVYEVVADIIATRLAEASWAREADVAARAANMPACPICGDGNGFHHEDIHDARPLPDGIGLPLPVAESPVDKPCRACGQPLDGPGAPGCRYPNHRADRLAAAQDEEQEEGN